VGPTGVGKTRAAESLPAALKSVDPTGIGHGYVRLDMAEYQERHRISQLFGAPQGYVGYGDRSQLVDALVENPKTIVLFDEIDKAHPDVLRSLMNAMDAGRISSPSIVGRGREVDCRQAIFLFTSNLDCDRILSELEERAAFEQHPVVDTVCQQRLRVVGMAPELIGRIGTFLVFQPLSLDARAEIVALSVKQVAEEYGLRVERIAPAVILSILKRVQPTADERQL
jgi:ATP-dependent Clp protease ATP-binding subunit ClpA